MGRRRRRNDLSIHDLGMAFRSPVAAGIMLVAGLIMLAIYYAFKPGTVEHPTTVSDLGSMIYGPLFVVEYVTAWVLTLVGGCALTIHLVKPKS